MDSSKLDPRLKKALDDAVPGDQPIPAVVVVGSATVLPRSETEQMLRDLVERAALEVDAQPAKLVLFPSVQSFSIEAEPKLLRRILEEDSIDAATLNEPY